MGKLYPYSTIWVKNIVVILHIIGDRSIFQLHQFPYHITQIQCLGEQKIAGRWIYLQ